MTHYELCPRCGYWMRGEQVGNTEFVWTCENHRWCPHHPGACPECGSQAKHKLAGMGMKEVACADCSQQWVPAVPSNG